MNATCNPFLRNLLFFKTLLIVKRKFSEYFTRGRSHRYRFMNFVEFILDNNTNHWLTDTTNLLRITLRFLCYSQYDLYDKYKRNLFTLHELNSRWISCLNLIFTAAKFTYFTPSEWTYVISLSTLRLARTQEPWARIVIAKDIRDTSDIWYARNIHCPNSCNRIFPVALPKYPFRCKFNEAQLRE